MTAQTIIVTAAGIAYRRQEFVDSWGRKRTCDKRMDDLPKPHAETCAVCGAALAAERSTRRFCGDACKMKEYRQRKRAFGGFQRASQ